MTVTVAITRTQEGIPTELRDVMNQLSLTVHRVHADDADPRRPALVDLALPSGAQPDQIQDRLMQVRQVHWAYRILR